MADGFGDFVSGFAGTFVPTMLQERKLKSQRDAWGEYAKQLEGIRNRNQQPQSPSQTPSFATGSGMVDRQYQYDPQGSFVKTVLPAMLPFWYGGGK